MVLQILSFTAEPTTQVLRSVTPLLRAEQVDEETDIEEVNHSVPIDIRLVKKATGLQDRNERGDVQEVDYSVLV